MASGNSSASPARTDHRACICGSTQHDLAAIVERQPTQRPREVIGSVAACDAHLGLELDWLFCVELDMVCNYVIAVSIRSMNSTDDSSIRSWFTGRLPDEWTSAGAPTFAIDREEITVTITIDPPTLDEGASAVDIAEATDGRISGFREDTRDRRMAIAREAEHRFERKVAWAVRVGDRTDLFAHLAVPVMTRLRQPERQVLDTLVRANIARSRADAVAWCVRLVGRNADEWLTELRDAMRSVDAIRDSGPDAS